MKSTLFLTTLALAASATIVSAQTPAAPQPNDPNRQGGDRARNYEEFRQRMAERLKTSMKVTDDEWSVIQPLVEKVTTKMREAGGGRGFGGPRGSGGPGGPGGGSGAPGAGNGGPAPTAPTSGDPNRPSTSPEREALRTALENENASPEELKSKLAALRESRKKATAELETLREDLKKVLTVRQEALLVSYGILE